MLFLYHNHNTLKKIILFNLHYLDPCQHALADILLRCRAITATLVSGMVSVHCEAFTFVSVHVHPRTHAQKHNKKERGAH